MELKEIYKLIKKFTFDKINVLDFIDRKPGAFLAIYVVSKFECGIFEQLFLLLLCNLLLGLHGTVGSQPFKNRILTCLLIYSWC